MTRRRFFAAVAASVLFPFAAKLRAFPRPSAEHEADMQHFCKKFFGRRKPNLVDAAGTTHYSCEIKVEVSPEETAKIDEMITAWRKTYGRPASGARLNPLRLN